MEQEINQLKAEIVHHINNLNAANAEKLASNQLLTDSVNALLNVKKELIILNQQIQQANQENANLKAELDKLKLVPPIDDVN